MRTVLSWAAMLALVVVLWLVARGTPANGSTDGRFHTCGYVTSQGVTDHLGAYSERCH